MLFLQMIFFSKVGYYEHFSVFLHVLLLYSGNTG